MAMSVPRSLLLATGLGWSLGTMAQTLGWHSDMQTGIIYDQAVLLGYDSKKHLHGASLSLVQLVLTMAVE